MFKGPFFDKHKEQKEPVDTSELTTLCTSYIEDLDDVAYKTLVRECADIGKHNLRFNFYNPPSLGLPDYIPYEGGGTINIDRTIREIGTHGRRLESIIARTHMKQKQKTNLAILIDNSAQMTANWISEKLENEINSEDSPQILIKLAAISILESLGKKADVLDIIIFGEDVEGPFNQSQLSYKELLQKTGSGPARLDMGLAKLFQLEWEMRPGSRLLFILGGGLPYIGENILIDDIEIQINVLYYLDRMMRQGVKVVYIPFFTKEGYLDQHVGAFSPRGFAEKIQQIGVTVTEINNEASLPIGLRNSLINMMIGPSRKMPVFE
jgi:hypothetical protein